MNSNSDYLDFTFQNVFQEPDLYITQETLKIKDQEFCNYDEDLQCLSLDIFKNTKMDYLELETNMMYTPKKVKLDQTNHQQETLLINKYSYQQIDSLPNIYSTQNFQNNNQNQINQLHNLNQQTQSENIFDNNLTTEVLSENNFFENKKRSIPIENIMIQIKMNKNEQLDNKKITKLALRNLKLNLGTGLNQFIIFKKEMALQKKDYFNYHLLNDLSNFIQLKLNRVRSSLGWIELWENPIYGKSLRQESIVFFGKSFSQSYIINSKIKQEYKKYYLKQIKIFYHGARNLERFSLRLKTNLN